MSDFKRLLVWQKAHALSLKVHRVAGRMRGPQYVALRSQMIRAAMSIPANIVEGRGQKSEREFARFLGYSLNSSSELEYHLLAARDFGVLGESDYKSTVGDTIEVRRMLYGLIGKLRTSKAEQKR